MNGNLWGRKDMVYFEEAQVLLLLDVPLVAMPRGSGSGLSWEHSRRDNLQALSGTDGLLIL